MAESIYLASLLVLLVAGNIAALRWAGRIALSSSPTLLRAALAIIVPTLLLFGLALLLPRLSWLIGLPWYLAAILFAVAALAAVYASLAALLRLSQWEALKALFFVSVVTGMLIGFEGLTMPM